MSRLRVLHMHSGMVGGGIETFIAEMSQALHPQCVSHLFSLSTGAIYEGPELPTGEDNTRASSFTASMRRLARHVRAWRPHVLHAHWPDAMRYAAVVRRLVRPVPRLVVHWHNIRSGTSNTPVGAWLGRYALSQADMILACSGAAADHHAAQCSIARDRIRVLHNPVDLSVFAGVGGDSGFRPRVGVGEGELLAVFLGRLSIEVKGLDVLCEAVRLLPPGFPLRVALVGPGEQEAVGEQLQPPAAVKLTWPIDRAEVPGVLQSCYICLQPSRSEGFPLSVIEAMAAGLPVIATRVGGIPEAVEDGVTGMLVEPEDPEALAEAIQWMVAHPAERQEMGRKGREQAQRFDVQNIASQLAEIYREVLDD